MDKLPNSFCILPWSHLFPWPNGSLHTCCEGSLKIGEAKNNFVEQMNSSSMIEIRKTIMSGQWHKNCEKCKIKEQSGFKSSRTTANSFYKESLLTKISNINSNGIIDVPKVLLLEFRLSNLCNFKCRTCDHNSSSAWFEDEKALAQSGLISHLPKEKILDSEIDIEAIKPSIEHVYKIEFAGGEPFLDSRVEKIIKHIIALGRQDEVILSFITNFSKFNPNSEIIPLLKKFKYKNFVISFDAMGSRAEYIRFGTHWESILKNYNYFLNEFSQESYFNIHCTYSIFNAFHIVEFHKWMTQEMNLPFDNFVFNLALGPDYISANIIPTPIKEKLINIYKQYQEGWRKLPENTVRNTFDGAIKYLSQKPENPERNKENLKTFFKHVDFLDKRRNESFEKTFPEWRELRSYI